MSVQMLCGVTATCDDCGNVIRKLNLEPFESSLAAAREENIALKASLQQCEELRVKQRVELLEAQAEVERLRGELLQKAKP